jgi:hypothetical protein
MKRLTFLIATASATTAASSSRAAGAEAGLLDEGFGNLAGMPGWNHPDHGVPPSAGLAAEPEGHFVFRQLGDPATLGQVGLETMRGAAAAAEPAGLLVLASSLGVIGLMQRLARH